MKLDHRTWLGAMTLGAAVVGLWVINGCSPGGTATKSTAWKSYGNDRFYTADGQFDAKAARQAFFEMFEYHGYPIPERLRTDEFWVTDFGLGKFTEVGMGGIFWINSEKDGYFGHEIFLLPGQMIAEHRHVKTEKAKPKIEAWHVRHGWVHLYSEGEPTPGVDERIPPLHREIAKARTETKAMPGDVVELRGPEEWHWMSAGPEGGILTEYATYHDGEALRFTHPDVKF